MTPLLPRLFETPLEQFVAETWPERWRFAPGSPARAMQFIDELLPPNIQTPASFLAAYPGRAWLHEVDADGHYEHETSLDSSEAASRFESGAMFDVRNVERWRREAAAWLSQLDDELALGPAARASYCHAFTSPRGSGVPKHFDNREVFVVQLLGTKRWELAAGSLSHPLAAHVLGGRTNALNRHAEAVLADATMAEATTLVLEPGAVLFLPRGTWHRTHALEDSLSFSFGLRVPSRLETVIAQVAHALSRSPQWEATAYDLSVVRPEGVEATARAMRAVIELLRASQRDKK